jgi:hypothetical protein
MHECEESKKRKYEIEQLGSELVWSVYDKLTHSYMLNILYCPFCGEAL